MKYIITCTICIFASVLAHACDICGCGSGSYYVGILPEFNAKIAGIRYRVNQLRSHVAPDGATSYLTSDEHYRTLELWGGWNLGQRFRLMAALPYSFNLKKEATETTMKSGLGDATIQGFYRLAGSRGQLTASRVNAVVRHDLWIGAGVKLPTGRYEPADNTGDIGTTNLFQTGTGSYDLLFTAMYDLRIQDAGLNVTGSYKMNTPNRYHYYYGNKASLSTQLYYKFLIHTKIRIAPNAGLHFESTASDLDDGYRVFQSGGYLLTGTVGAELNFGKIAAGANLQLPLTQRLAQGAVVAEPRFMLHTALVF